MAVNVKSSLCQHPRHPQLKEPLRSLKKFCEGRNRSWRHNTIVGGCWLWQTLFRNRRVPTQRHNESACGISREQESSGSTRYLWQGACWRNGKLKRNPTARAIVRQQILPSLETYSAVALLSFHPRFLPSLSNFLRVKYEVAAMRAGITLVQGFTEIDFIRSTDDSGSGYRNRFFVCRGPNRSDLLSYSSKFILSALETSTIPNARAYFTSEINMSEYEGRSGLQRLNRRIMDDISAAGHPRVDTTRPTLGFPLGTALILLIVFGISALFSCCYHWEKIRNIHNRYDGRNNSSQPSPRAFMPSALPLPASPASLTPSKNNRHQQPQLASDDARRRCTEIHSMPISSWICAAKHWRYDFFSDESSKIRAELGVNISFLKIHEGAYCPPPYTIQSLVEFQTLFMIALTFCHELLMDTLVPKSIWATDSQSSTAVDDSNKVGVIYSRR
eukprot:Gb_06691 [translate_table: standard]